MPSAAKYLEQREYDGAAVRGNREKPMLSHCITKAMVQGWVDANPCRGVHRNRERPREPMIEDAEAAIVFAIAVPSVRRMMTLIYSSCQRPEDCLRFGPANIKRTEKDGREIRILRVRQAKTTKSLDSNLAASRKRSSTSAWRNPWSTRPSCIATTASAIPPTGSRARFAATSRNPA
jgi:hypothetical protein